MSRQLSFAVVFLFTAFLFVNMTAFIVPEMQQAIVLEFNKPVAQYTEPGLKFKVPFIQTVKSFDKRVLDADPPPEEVILFDKKRLVVDAFARYRITDMLQFSIALQNEDQAGSRLNNIINSTLRNALGTATLSDVLSEKRAGLMTGIRKQVNDSVKDFGIEIVDVRIGRADLPEQTSESVYNRMKSERQREAAEFRAQGQELAREITSKAEKERTIILADAEKKAQILRGEGDAVAGKIRIDAFRKDPEFYSFYRTLQAYRNSLGGDGTTLILKPEGEFFRYFGNELGRSK